MKKHWKLGIIGGTGRIACAMVCDLVKNPKMGEGEVVLYGRSAEKMKRNLTLIGRVAASEKTRIEVRGTHDLDEAIRGSDVILYNADSRMIESGGFTAFGIYQGAHMLDVGQLVAKLAPDAWFLCDTNPTDVPVAALHRKYGLRRVMGLCNATDILQRVVSSYVGCEREEIGFSEIGVNHEAYYLDILRNGTSIYDELRRTLPTSYDPAKMKSAYLDVFPEWPRAFQNNVVLMSAIGFLTAPCGAPGRYRGLPIKDIYAGATRPTDEDYQGLVSRNAGADEILKVIRRCGGGIPVYIARVMSGLLSNTPAQESVQLLNEGILPDQPKTAVVQVNCRICNLKVSAPKRMQLPENISAVLASLIRQRDLTARALAEQNADLMRQALLVCPERVEIAVADRVARGKENIEPHMQLS
jgi:alpha-galactosidase